MNRTEPGGQRGGSSIRGGGGRTFPWGRFDLKQSRNPRAVRADSNLDTGREDGYV